MSRTSSVSVVRIGFASTGTLDGIDPVDEVLHRALKAHFDSIASATITDAVSASDGHLAISNRYFTARVALEPLNKSSTSIVAKLDPSQQEDGVLLLFWEEVKTAHSMSLFDELASLHDQAERDGLCGELLRLCVRAYFGGHDPPSSSSSSSSSSLTAKQQEEEYARRILWCLDRGYEYIEADLSDEGVKQGHDARDKDGFARIVEAISGTVWSSAVMNSSAKTQLQTSYQQAAENLGPNQDTNDESRTVALPISSPEPISATLETISATTAKSETVSLSTSPFQSATTDAKEASICDEMLSSNLPLTADEIKEADEKAVKLLSQEEHSPFTIALDSAGTAPLTQEDEEHDGMLQNFEIALREATRIRELSKSGALNDDERRQRAGDAANLLMSMLDQMGFDDDDDDEDNNDAGEVPEATS